MIGGATVVGRVSIYGKIAIKHAKHWGKSMA